jgi:hypothetical protein
MVSIRSLTYTISLRTCASVLALLLDGCTVLYVQGDGNTISGSNTRGDFTPIPLVHHRDGPEGLQRLLPGH